MNSELNRRGLLTSLIAATLPAQLRAGAGHFVRLGGPIFLKTQDPREMAQEHRRLGYSAAYCPPAKVEDTSLIREIEKAFKAEDVVIAEVGAFGVNMLDPDAEKQRAALRFVTDRLALAEAVAARCCVNVSGSFNPRVWYGPDPRNLSKEFFDGTVENCRQVVDAVRPKRTKFSLEMMGWSLPDGPDSYLKLLTAIDRSGFGVHLDPCNGINCPARFYRNGPFIAECFRLLGPWIVSCHAKDLEWPIELNVHFVEVVPGRGQMDYREYLRQLQRLPVDAPLMLEHLKAPAEYAEGRAYIRNVGREAGVSFA